MSEKLLITFASVDGSGEEASAFDEISLHSLVQEVEGDAGWGNLEKFIIANGFLLALTCSSFFHEFLNELISF
jgi:hypothetical protein